MSLQGIFLVNMQSLFGGGCNGACWQKYIGKFFLCVQGGLLCEHCAGWDFVRIGLLRRLIVCLDWLPHTTATAELREIVRPRSTDDHQQATIVCALPGVGCLCCCNCWEGGHLECQVPPRRCGITCSSLSLSTNSFVSSITYNSLSLSTYSCGGRGY